jgi:hypothetical protein
MIPGRLKKRGIGITSNWTAHSNNAGGTVHLTDTKTHYGRVKDRLKDIIRNDTSGNPLEIDVLTGNHGNSTGHNYRNGRRRKSLGERGFFLEDEYTAERLEKRYGRKVTINVIDTSQMSEAAIEAHMRAPRIVVVASCYSRVDPIAMKVTNSSAGVAYRKK